MAAQQGFRSYDDNPYVYQETTSGASVAFGVNSSENVFKLTTLPTPGASAFGVGNIEIDPSATGSITITPNSTGRVDISNLTVSSGSIILSPIAGARSSTIRANSSGQLSTLLDPVADGQLLISSNAGAPVWANLTAGSGVTITNGHNSISISAGAGFDWNEVSGTTVDLVADNGYIFKHATDLVTATLPATCAVGSRIALYAFADGNFTIAQRAGQQIHFGNIASTSGVTGGVYPNEQYDYIELLCVVADTTFAVISSLGNFIIL